MTFDPDTLTRDFGDPIGEARACRQQAALFDFSFMARARVTGPFAARAIATITRRPVTDMAVGRIRYALREAGDGHLVADLTVWRTAPDAYEVMSGRDSDIADLVAAVPSDEASTLTSETAIFAVQGPRALDVLSPVVSNANFAVLRALGYYCCADIDIAGVTCTVGRLGYTGERGFEIIAPRTSSAGLWRNLVERTRPAGFIAADMLRIEAGFVLFANEFLVPATAAEAGMGVFTRSEFEMPRTAEAAHPISLISFVAETPERPALWSPSQPVGRPSAIGELVVTSACHSLLAGTTLGLGYIRRDTQPTCELYEPTGYFSNIRHVSRPFYDPQKLVPRSAWP
ncbi:MAG: aminomethyltransferase family protein [Hyphomicrobiaceae bacterium]|nr:aminomethyltransferase family protein [Hyphomicrobiaceae bacterium]